MEVMRKTPIFAVGKSMRIMTRKLLTMLFSAALVLGVPTLSYAVSAVEIIDNELQTINISVTESTLHVAGVRVMSLKVEGADKHFELNLPKGCYIVKVGKVVRKISIK